MYLIPIDESIFNFLSFSGQVKITVSLISHLKLHRGTILLIASKILPYNPFSVAIQPLNLRTAELQLWNATSETKTSAYTFQVSAGFGISVKCLATDFCLIQVHDWAFGWWIDCKPLQANSVLQELRLCLPFFCPPACFSVSGFLSRWCLEFYNWHQKLVIISSCYPWFTPGKKVVTFWLHLIALPYMYHFWWLLQFFTRMRYQHFSTRYAFQKRTKPHSL